MWNCIDCRTRGRYLANHTHLKLKINSFRRTNRFRGCDVQHLRFLKRVLYLKSRSSSPGANFTPSVQPWTLLVNGQRTNIANPRHRCALCVFSRFEQRGVAQSRLLPLRRGIDTAWKYSSHTSCLALQALLPGFNSGMAVGSLPGGNIRIGLRGLAAC